MKRRLGIAPLRQRSGPSQHAPVRWPPASPRCSSPSSFVAFSECWGLSSPTLAVPRPSMSPSVSSSCALLKRTAFPRRGDHSPTTNRATVRVAWAGSEFPDEPMRLPPCSPRKKVFPYIKRRLLEIYPRCMQYYWHGRKQLLSPCARHHHSLLRIGGLSHGSRVNRSPAPTHGAPPEYSRRHRHARG